MLHGPLFVFLLWALQMLVGTWRDLVSMSTIRCLKSFFSRLGPCALSKVSKKFCQCLMSTVKLARLQPPQGTKRESSRTPAVDWIVSPQNLHVGVWALSVTVSGDRVFRRQVRLNEVINLNWQDCGLVFPFSPSPSFSLSTYTHTPRVGTQQDRGYLQARKRTLTGARLDPVPWSR